MGIAGTCGCSATEWHYPRQRSPISLTDKMIDIARVVLEAVIRREDHFYRHWRLERNFRAHVERMLIIDLGAGVRIVPVAAAVGLNANTLRPNAIVSTGVSSIKA